MIQNQALKNKKKFAPDRLKFGTENKKKNVHNSYHRLLLEWIFKIEIYGQLKKNYLLQVGHHRILFSLAQYNVGHLKMFTRINYNYLV